MSSKKKSPVEVLPKARRRPKSGAIIHVAREFGGIAEAGGLKDVTEGLARASAAAGHDTHVFLPFYGLIDERKLPTLSESCQLDVPMNYALVRRSELVTVHSTRLQPNLTVHLLRARRYRFLLEGSGRIRRRGIYIYTREEAAALGWSELEGKGYFDFFAMNVLLVKAALLALAELALRPQVVHCHDGHTALLPLIAQESRETIAPFLAHVPTILTIHNAGMGYHQEVADLPFAAAVCGVPGDVVRGCLLGGSFDPLLAGGLYAGVVNTVSENYARELQRTGRDWLSGWLGHALAGRGITLRGVTNGIDPGQFDPRDAERLGLAAPFSVTEGDLEGKEVCKQALLEALGRGEAPAGVTLHGSVACRPGQPLVTFIGRLDPQKGFDTLAEALRPLLTEDPEVQLLGLGSGGPALERRFAALAAEFPGRVLMAVGYDGTLATRIYAAGDFFVIPSRFEPCGLTDFIAQLLGNVPVVHEVGGLVKTVDGRFGFAYRGGASELGAALRRAIAAYRRPDQALLRRIQRQAARNVLENFTWARVLEKKYLPLYQEAEAATLPTLPD